MCHFRNQSSTIQAQFELSPDLLKMPQPPVITHEQTNYFQHHQHVENCIPVEFTPPASKILFIYEATSSSGKIIKIMADPGATISLIIEQEKEKLGDIHPVGYTRINGVGNQQLSQNSSTVQLSLKASFGKTWKHYAFEAAILPVIKDLQEKDHTQAIVMTSQVLQEKILEFMTT